MANEGVRHATPRATSEPPPLYIFGAICPKDGKGAALVMVPPNITILPLPAKCQELNPQKNVWQFMRDNWLSNRVFKSYEDIVNHCCCYAWNRLIDRRNA